VSEIFSALQALDIEQREQRASASRPRVQLVASTVSSSEFSVLREFFAPRADDPEEHEPEASVNQEQEHAALAASANDLSALEQRIARVVETVKQERQARTAAEERALQAEAEMSEQAARMEDLQKELNAMKGERNDGHQRVERMVTLLDSLGL
jgi:chromosome segregation ATPase